MKPLDLISAATHLLDEQRPGHLRQALFHSCRKDAHLAALRCAIAASVSDRRPPVSFSRFADEQTVVVQPEAVTGCLKHWTQPEIPYTLAQYSQCHK